MNEKESQEFHVQSSQVLAHTMCWSMSVLCPVTGRTNGRCSMMRTTFFLARAGGRATRCLESSLHRLVRKHTRSCIDLCIPQNTNHFVLDIGKRLYCERQYSSLITAAERYIPSPPLRRLNLFSLQATQETSSISQLCLLGQPPLRVQPVAQFLGQLLSQREPKKPGLQ